MIGYGYMGFSGNSELSDLPDNVLGLVVQAMVKADRKKLAEPVANLLASVDMLIEAATNEDFPRFRAAVDALGRYRNDVVSVITEGLSGN